MSVKVGFGVKLPEAVSLHISETKFLLTDRHLAGPAIAQHRKPSPTTITPFLAYHRRFLLIH